MFKNNWILENLLKPDEIIKIEELVLKKANVNDFVVSRSNGVAPLILE